MLPNVSDSSGDRMNTHNNARLTPKGREEMVRAVVDHSLSKAAAARRFNTTSKTVAKWVDRFNAQGLEGRERNAARVHLSLRRLFTWFHLGPQSGSHHAPVSASLPSIPISGISPTRF